MTTTSGRTSGSDRAARTVTAFLDGPDNPNIPNAIHSTDGAKEYGYEAALVGGVTVYGWATPTILEALGESWLDEGWAEVSFRRPTYPGEELAVSVAPEEDGGSELHMTGRDGHDRIAGLVGLGRAPWFASLTRPERHQPEERPAELPQLTPASAPVGEDLRPQAVPTPIEEHIEYAAAKQRTDDPLFVGPVPLVHPGWIAGRMTRLLHHSYDYGPAINARSHIQHLARVEAGQTLVVSARFAEAYERKGHQYAVIDGLIQGEDGRDLVRLRHTTIYLVARRT
jgi:acyl dehydratase